VLVGEFDDDAVFSGDCRQIAHGACTILVVHTVNLCLGWTLDCQRQSTCM